MSLQNYWVWIKCGDVLGTAVGIQENYYNRYENFTQLNNECLWGEIQVKETVHIKGT